ANARALAATGVGNTLAALAVPLALVPRLALSGVLLLAGAMLAGAAVAFAGAALVRRRALLIACALGVLAYGGVRAARGWEDAALFVRGARETYDVIVSEPSNPWVVGMADLFTLEALTAMRARLAPGGVAAAWLHAYSTDAGTYASVLATFREVFPRSALIE